jgi:RsmE family RNA methyltransferase
MGYAGDALNLLLLDPEEAGTTGETVLADRRARHLIGVLAVAPGATLRAAIVGGALGTATVLAVDAGAAPRVTVRFVATGEAPPPAVGVDLIVAVPRPKVLSRVVQIAAAFGVGAIHLTRSWRVDKAYMSSPRLAPDALALDARLGAEQGGAPRLPAVTVHDRFMAMLEAVPTRPRSIVLHPRDAAPIERALAPGVATPVLAAIGPEGGWIDREVATFVDRGFTVVGIARPVLRVEAAVAALLGQAALLARLTSAG